MGRIDPASVNGTVRVEVTLVDVPTGVRSDESVTAQIELERLPDTLWIARPAGAADDTTMPLYRLRGNDRAERVVVSLGHSGSAPISLPAWDPTSRMFAREIAAIRMKS